MMPVMLDRAHQCLIKLALEPEWEARFEPMFLSSEMWTTF
jgi:retron-type reverse transcriptase